MSFKDYVVQNVISIVDKNQKLFESMKNLTCPTCEKDFASTRLYVCKICETFGRNNCISFTKLCSEHKLFSLNDSGYTKCGACRKSVWCNKCFEEFN